MSEPPKPTRVIVNAIEILGPPMSNIIHDLGPDEVACPTCQGVGMFKTEERSPDRTWDGGNWVYCTPWHNHYLVTCGSCYYGKAKLCEHCHEPRRRFDDCQCSGAVAHRDQIEHDKEEQRRAMCKRVALDDYEGEMVYAANNSTYIMTDSIEYYLAESPSPADEVFFACTPAEVDCSASAADIIERMRETASENSDEIECVEFSKDAEQALANALGEWEDKHCTFATLFWQDENTIVEVPRAMVEAAEGEGE